MTGTLAAEIWARLAAVDDMVDDTVAFVLAAAAEHLRAEANRIAAAPPDPNLDPRAGVNFLVAEGWYQAADMIRPKEETT